MRKREREGRKEGRKEGCQAASDATVLPLSQVLVAMCVLEFVSYGNCDYAMNGPPCMLADFKSSPILNMSAHTTTINERLNEP